MTIPTELIAVIQTLHNLVNAGDLERVLVLFTDDAVVRNLPPPEPPETGLHTGKQEIRAWFAPQIQNHLHVTSQNYHVMGDVVAFDTTLSDDGLRAMGIEEFDVTTEAVVQNGKITSFNVTFTPESLRKLEEAEGEAEASA